MLTIFSIPKPFHGHIAVIQHNAIYSWTLLHPKCEIILFGDEVGVAETASEFKVKHIPHLTCNEYGTPYLDSVFEQVKQIAKNSLLCYVNADIILLDNFIKAVERIRFSRFLMVGQRWNIDVSQQWDFEQANWAEQLSAHVNKYGELHGVTGSDYFVFPRVWDTSEFPPFVVGRPGWDNWFIYLARKQSIPVVDATRVVTVVHQNHEYNHISKATGTRWLGPEADHNLRLMDEQYIFTLRDSTHMITTKGILPALNYEYYEVEAAETSCPA